MTTHYDYDATDGVLDKIRHQDGANVLQSFDYTYDDAYQITGIEHADGSNWGYVYDDRYRLTQATRNNQLIAPGIKAVYDYAYDAGDNMTSKTVPFEDNFDDGNMNGWTHGTGSTWAATNGHARKTDPSTNQWFHKSVTDADLEVQFDYENFDDSDLANTLSLRLRRVGGDVLDLDVRGDRLRVRQKFSGVWTTLQEDLTAGSLEGTRYTIRAAAKGSSVKVWRKAEGGMESLILDTTTQVLGQSLIIFSAAWGDDYSIDNIRILADDLSSTTTFTSNNANELTSVADYNGTTAITYDAWGRTTSKTRGTDSMTYEWAKGNFLTAVDATSWGPIGQRRITARRPTRRSRVSFIAR